MTRPTPPPTRGRWEDNAVFLAVFLVFSLTFLLHTAHYLSTWVDDAYISFRFGRMLWEGHGPYFNADEPLEGVTNLAWTVLLAPFTHGDPLSAARGFGVAASIGTVGLLVDAARRSGLGWVGASVACGTWALLPWAPFWSVQGLETSMVAFLVTLAWSRPPTERWPWAGLGAALAPAFHPISGGLVLLIALRHLLVHGLRVWRAAVVVLIGAALLVGAKLHWYGRLLPNTFAVKTRPWPWPNGVTYVENALTEPSALFGVVLIVAMILALLRPLRARFQRRPAPDLSALPALVVAGALGTAWVVNGDLFANYRLIVPALPAVGLVLGGLAAALARRVGGALTVALVGWLLVPMARVQSLDGLALGAPRRVDKVAALWRPEQGPEWGRGLSETWAFPSAYILVNVPTEHTVAFTDIGLFSYLAPQRVVDLLGLCTGPLVKGRDEAPAAAFARMSTWVSEQVQVALVDQGSDRYAGMRLTDRKRWERIAGCGEVIALRRVGVPELRVGTAELAIRLETVLRRTPAMPGLHIAIARELAHIGEVALLESFVTGAAALSGEQLSFYWRQARCELDLGEGCAPVDACGGAAAQSRW